MPMTETTGQPTGPISPLTGDALGEIKAKIDFWRVRLQNQLYRFNSYADMWRLLKPNRPSDLSGFANPQLTETTRATEAIATFIYRALTSAMPNFQLISHNPQTSHEQLWQSESVISWQLVKSQYNRKLLRALRSSSLMGTVGIEQPFVEVPGIWQGTDFVPLSLLQMAFDPMAFDISQSSWHASLNFVSEEQLMRIGKQLPGVFDGKSIESGIAMVKNKNMMSPEILARLASAGYYSYAGSDQSSVHYLVTYYGPLKNNPTENGRDWCVSVLNDSYIIRAHPSSYRNRPFDFAMMNEFEMEPYGYGVGQIAEAMQPEMNSNRGRMHDTITYSLLNMWVASRMANIKTSQLQVRPWGVVEVDGESDGLKPLRPQIEAVNFGIQLENLMKSEFRSTTGATDNLQAIVTEASATEASIAQSEAVRRLSVIAEIKSEALLRRHVMKMHENNLEFLDQPFWIANTGKPAQPMRVFPGDLAPDVEVIIKIVTDKDFRPQRNKDIISFLQIMTSIRNQLTPQTIGVILPFVQEFARGVQVDPSLVVQSLLGAASLPQDPSIQQTGAGVGGAAPTAMDRVGQGLETAENVRSMAGELGAQARQFGQASREEAGI